MANTLSSKSAFLSYLCGWIAIASLMTVVMFGPGSTSKKTFNNPNPSANWEARLQ